MLQFFRQRGLSNVLYGAIILATILTFVIEFRPNAAQRTASLTETCVARVRGRCIEPKDFFSAYRMLMPSRSAQVSRRLNLKRVALDGLVERELLDDEAKRLGITVTDGEVTDQLYNGFVRVSVPAADPSVAQSILHEMYEAYARGGLISSDVAQTHFNDRDGALPVDFRDPKTKSFDMKTYERQVRNLSNRSTVEFREQQLRELLAAKMRDLVRDPVRVSGTETWQEYDRRYSTATVTWIAVKESWAARWAVDPKASEAWATEHQAEFQKALEERQKEDAPKAGHLRHILVKVPYGASPDEKGVALAKLSWAAARVRAGESFAEVARDASDDSGSAINGGDVGDKTDGFVAPFRAAADALKPGETTPGAVETQFGYHLITKDDPARAPEIAAAVKRSLPREMLAKERATEAARTVAGRIADRLRDGKSAADAIVGAIAPYTRPGRTEILRVLPPPAATDGDAGAASSGGAEAGANAAANASETHAAREKPPTADNSRRDPAAGTGTRRAGATSGDEASPESKAFDASTDPERPQLQTSTAFNRGGDPFPGLSPEGTRSVVEFAFSAQDGNVMPDPPRTSDGYVVVQLQQHKRATREDLEKNREVLEQDLLRAKRDEALSLYVKRVRAQAKDSVKVDESYVQEARVDGGAGADDDDEQY